ncbi:MAG: hypothetical protein PHD13_06150 [Methanocellales archaeon]|nr:hypothetical protein [Methanocellales archaeon]MDD3292195.1 hypothetical protein [Methanocellales archaeon]MDD5235738.1 hypothetical protein [Methanocellales archaeon]MDD5485803.1 hypothetical protein [Methanocellales archaeon]
MEKVRLFGFALFGFGVIICLTYALYHFIKASEVPLIIRLGVVGIIAGVVFLLISVIRERFEEEEEVT